MRMTLATTLALLFASAWSLSASASEEGQQPGPIAVVELPALFFDPYQPVSADNAPEMPAAAIPVRAAPSMEAPLITTLVNAEGIHWATLDNEGSAAAFSYGLEDGWHRIRFTDGSMADGWVAPQHTGEVRWMMELLRDSLSFTTARWDGQIHATPLDSTGTAVAGAGPRTAVEVVREVSDAQGQPWYLVLVLSDGGCDGDYPEVLGSGYIPAVVDGESTVWFWAGGC